MKKSFIVLVGAFLLVAAFSFPATPLDTYTVDPAHSTILFRIKHLGMTYVYGRFNDFSGTLTFNESDTSQNTLAVSIKAASIDTGIEKRDAHLRNADFFHVEKFPTLSFTSDTFEKAGPDRYEVTGELFLHGVKRPLTVVLEKTGSGKDPWGGYRVGFETRFKIKRSDYGMDHSLGPVGDTVRIDVSLEAIRK